MPRLAVLSVAAALLVAAPGFSTSAPADDRAVAACKKHVESKLHEAIHTSYDAGMSVEPVDERTVSVAGRFTSKNRSGQTTSADFRCKATRYGVLWTTSMQLLRAP